LTAYQAAEQSPRLADLSPLQLKIARTLYATSDFASAVTVYQTVYASTASDVTRAEADYGMGSAQIALGQYELAYAQFQDAVNNYPAAYASYQALVELVDAGVTVDELSRGLVDYFAGQYVPAINALDRYLAAGGEDSGTALHYKALILRELGDPASALIVWQQLIDTIPGHRFWPDAWEEKAYTLWAYQDDPVSAAAAMLTFADQNPAHDRAADFLFQAGRYLERAGSLAEAAAAWDRVVDGYPASENAYRSLFLAGISRYRLGDKAAARNTFQRGLLLSEDSINLSASYYWIGKIQEEEGDVAAAENSWQQAVTRDPTGYYSERARDRLLKRDSFTSPEFIDYGFDLILEKQDADAWMRTTFNLPPETNLDGLGGLESDGRIIRGQEFWALGLYNEARSEFESLRNEVSEDPAATYRLAGYFNAIGLYRSAITASRQVLSLARLDDAGTLTAPAYFNHIRFAPNFRQLVFQAAEEESLTPLFIFSLMRQESLFEGFVVSSAGARGLMQIMPETGQQVAANMGWPAGFTPSDLYRPTVSIRLGTHYLARQLVAFDGDFYRALAAYNGGPGNAMAWSDLAGNDQDLFLEVIRIQESRDYLMRIFEIFSIYRRIYGRTP
jgi:soluble lytic murein transglycosylase